MKRTRKTFKIQKQIQLNISNAYPLNYKNVLLLINFITISGKILPKRLNHLPAKRQRRLSKAIKNARLMSFLPFVRLIDS